VNTPDHVAAVLAKAEAGDVHPAELAALRRRLRQLDEPQAGFLPGAALEPLPDLPRLDQLPEPPPGRARELLGRLVVVKLNGGLGTSMGLAGPIAARRSTRTWASGTTVFPPIGGGAPLRHDRHQAGRVLPLGLHPARRRARRQPR
jgi:UTP--glucose-1-phosphate uridylyltransferase